MIALNNGQQLLKILAPYANLNSLRSATKIHKEMQRNWKLNIGLKAMCWQKNVITAGLFFKVVLPMLDAKSVELKELIWIVYLNILNFLKMIGSVMTVQNYSLRIQMMMNLVWDQK
jgi:hypothetical protein